MTKWVDHHFRELGGGVTLVVEWDVVEMGGMVNEGMGVQDMGGVYNG